MDTKKEVTKTSKELGVLRGGQIASIVGWGVAVLFGLLLAVGTTQVSFDPASVDVTSKAYVYVLAALFILLPTVAFILTLVGWNRFGPSIAAGIFYIISSVTLFLSFAGLILAALLLAGGILILCGAYKLK